MYEKIISSRVFLSNNRNFSAYISCFFIEFVN